MTDIKKAIINNEHIDLQKYDCSVLLHSLLEFVKNKIHGLIPDFLFMELVDAYHNIEMNKIFTLVNKFVPIMTPNRRIILAELLEICKIIKDNEDAVVCTYADSIHKLAEYVFQENYYHETNTHRLKVIVLDHLSRMDFYHLPEWLALFDL